MSISSELVGRRYPASRPYRVSRAKVAEFARALGDDNPAYFDSENPIAPPTFAAIVLSSAWEPMFADPALGIALERTVHADQKFELTRPLREGDDVVASSVIEKIRSRGDVDMITVKVELSTTDGEDLGSATSQLFCTKAAS